LLLQLEAASSGLFESYGYLQFSFAKQLKLRNQIV